MQQVGHGYPNPSMKRSNNNTPTSPKMANQGIVSEKNPATVEDGQKAGAVSG